MKECNGTCESCDCKNKSNSKIEFSKNTINKNFIGIDSLSFGEGWGEDFNHQL
jgi:hypothetical protein